MYGVGTRTGAAWDGDLVLKGFGDPTLSSPDIERLAATIRGRGIRSITGRVLGDESFYDSRRAVAGWKGYFLGGETPPLSALIVDQARGWPALSPPLLAARALRDALTRRGVTVAGRPGLGVAPAAATSLASDTSDPLAAIVRRMNRESDNFYAEMLLKQLAAAAGKPGTSAGGGEIVIAAMREAGIPVTGRAHRRRLGPLEPRPAHRSRTRGRSPRRGDRSLDRARLRRTRWPSRAASGTLQDRLPALRGVVRGKTGTTNLACTLSGLIGKEDRVRRARERESGLVVGGARRAGPVRDDPGGERRRARSSRGGDEVLYDRGRGMRLHYEASSRARSSASPRIGTPAFSAFAAFEPGLSPTITPVVFFETESETFAPSASSAAFASSRV